MKKEILQQLMASSEYLSGFRLKGEGFFKKASDGWEVIEIEGYTRGWNMETDKPALRLYPIYLRRFDILHKWFEPFSFKDLKDQRSNYTIGFDGKMLDTSNYFYFPQDGSRYSERFTFLKENIEKNAKAVFTRYATVEDFYRHKVQPLLDNGISILPNVGADWIFFYLKSSQLVAPHNYPIIRNKIMKQVEMMNRRGEPNVIEIYPKLNEILNALEQ